MQAVITDIKGREILGGRGQPAVEALLTLSSGLTVAASVPSGTSKGRHEAVELYDGGTRFGGKGVKTAAANVSTEICFALIGLDVTDQRLIDRRLKELDGTPDKSRLGSNAILAVSAAAARAAAAVSNMPLYRYLGGFSAAHMPDISSTVLSGGAYSPSSLEFEDYLVIMEDFPSFEDQVEALCALRIYMENKLKSKFGFYPEDAGAYAPPLSGTAEAFELMLESARAVGCEGMVKLGIDVAANECYDAETGTYLLSKKRYDPETLLHYYKELCRDYPLIYIEDGFEEDAFRHFAKLKAALKGLMVVGDDLFATNIERLKIGVATDAANTLLLKINQIGTISESFDAVLYAKRNGYEIAASLRSNETNDDFAADMAVAAGARQIKLGSPFRAERGAKYNRLLKIAGELAGV